jgi:hypothetical protein
MMLKLVMTLKLLWRRTPGFLRGCSLQKLIWFPIKNHRKMDDLSRFARSSPQMGESQRFSGRGSGRLSDSSSDDGEASLGTKSWIPPRMKSPQAHIFSY